MLLGNTGFMPSLTKIIGESMFTENVDRCKYFLQNCASRNPKQSRTKDHDAFHYSHELHDEVLEHVVQQ